MRLSCKHLLIAALFLSSGCDKGPVVSTVSVEGPTTLNVFTRSPVDLPTVHFRHKGEDVPDRKAMFTSRDPSILRIENGKMIPMKNGVSGFDVTTTGTEVTKYIGVIVTIVDELELLCRPRSCQIGEGDLVAMQVEARSQGKMVFADPEWKSADEEVLTSQGKGQFLGKKTGRARALARIGDVVAQRSIVVRAPPPDEIAVTCKRPKITFRALRAKKDVIPERSCSVRRGKGSDLSVKVLSRGKVLPMRQASISVGKSSILRIDGNRMIGLSRGTEVVRVSLEGLSVSIPVEVR